MSLFTIGPGSLFSLFCVRQEDVVEMHTIKNYRALGRVSEVMIHCFTVKAALELP